MLNKLLQHKLLITALGAAIILLGAIVVLQLHTLNKAHSTFDNYYTFRGCTQLLKRTSTYGICKTGSGKVITIVLYHGKWYLQGDLPTGILGHLN